MALLYHLVYRTSKRMYQLFLDRELEAVLSPALKLNSVMGAGSYFPCSSGHSFSLRRLLVHGARISLTVAKSLATSSPKGQISDEHRVALFC
jgi:hypothetical protein